MAKKKTTTKSKAKPPQKTFEESIEALRLILTDLESGNLSLSDSLEKYELGVGHLKNCHHTLENAKQKIELLVRVDKNGDPITTKFDDAATYEEPVSGLNEDEHDDLENENDNLEDELDDEGGLF